MINSSLDKIAMDAAAQAAAAANDLYHGDGGDEYPDHANDVEHYDSMRRRKSPLSDLSKGTVKVKPNTAEEEREGSCRNQTGYIGVRQRKWGMFAAEIRDGDKRRWLGSFPSGREAGMAYDAAAISQKGCKAKTNFRYDDFASIPRKEAAMETTVRWDLLAKEVAERFPRPSDPHDQGGIDYATRRRADTYSEPSNCITSESYEQAPKRSRSSSGAAVHTGHGYHSHGHRHQQDHAYDHIKAAAVNVASMHFGGPSDAQEYNEDEAYHVPINPHMYGLMQHNHHAAAVAANYMYEGAPMDDGSNVQLHGGRMCTREYEQRHAGGVRGRPPAAPPAPMHTAGRGSVGGHPIAGRRAHPSDDGMSGDGGRSSHPASPSMVDSEHHHNHRLHHPHHHYAYDAHIAAGGGYAHPLAAHMMMYAGQGPTSGGTVLSTKHMAETMYMAHPYMQPHAGLPYPHTAMHYSHEHEYDDDDEEDMGPGHAVTELDMQRWKGVAGGCRYSSGGGSDLAQVLKRVSDDGASKDPSTGNIHVDPHLAQEGAHAIVAAAVAVASSK